MKYKQTVSLIAVSLAVLTPFSIAQARMFGKSSPFLSTDLPANSHLRNALDSAPTNVKAIAMTKLHEFSFPESDTEFLNVTPQGGIFYHEPSLTQPIVSAAAITNFAASQLTTGINALTLHSKPGSTNVVYLDFDGEVITGTAWNTIAPAVTSYNALPYDIETPPNPAFNAAELSQIQEIWHRVAEDYAPFDIDVTTELPLSYGPTVGHVLITKNVDAASVPMPTNMGGGVAFVNIWGSVNNVFGSPALVYANNLGPNHPAFIAEAVAHEFGHNLGLSHDGVIADAFGFPTAPNPLCPLTAAYFCGFDISNSGTQNSSDSLVSWGPIMGVGYYTNVTEWSKGEYPGANNTQDDLAIISAFLPYRADLQGNNVATAAPLTVDATGNISVTNPQNDPGNTAPQNKGIIETSSDVDMFWFNASAGTVNLNVTPAWLAFTRTGGPSDKRGANLDLKVTLYDSSGTPITTADPNTDTNAIISATVTTGGRYYLGVANVGNTVTPYSNYGSLGEYFISGNVPPYIDTLAPTPNPMTWAATPTVQSSTSITMTASTAVDETGTPVQYQFVCVAGGVNCVNSAWQSSTTYVATGLAAGTYSFNVLARDQAGNVTGASTTASVTITLDTTAPTPNPMTWAIVPTVQSSSSITMTATTAVDNSGTPVQYQFVCVAGGLNCVSSAWQSSTTYVATGLAAGTYSFNVLARDQAGNVTKASTTASATIDITPPTPNPMTFKSLPTATSYSSISMTATTAVDNSGSAVQYQFQCITGGTGCVNSAWQSSTSYVASGLAAKTTYSFIVVARDAAGNVTNPSVAASATTLAAPPIAPSSLAATALTGKSIKLTWKDNSTDETSFSLERSTNGTTWSAIVSLAANVTTYTNCSLTAGTVYYYRIKAVNSAGSSAYSNVVSAKAIS